MSEHSPIAVSGSGSLKVAALRAELGLTLAEMGEQIGLSKSQMHDVEKSDRASLRVALEIERLSGGRIDAADLNDDVRASRHGLEDRAAQDETATGNANGVSRDVAGQTSA